LFVAIDAQRTLSQAGELDLLAEATHIAGPECYCVDKSVDSRDNFVRG
jgi:hypothetical protein